MEHTIDSVNPILSNFSAESEGGNQVTFTLGGTDADSGIMGYNIAYSTDREVYTILTTLTGNSWTCEIDLQTEYFFKAQAIDNVGNVSDWSDAITVTQKFSPCRKIILKANLKILHSIPQKVFLLSATVNQQSIYRFQANVLTLPVCRPILTGGRVLTATGTYTLF